MKTTKRLFTVIEETMGRVCPSRRLAGGRRQARRFFGSAALAAAVAMASFGAYASQFKPDGGGNLDAADNWNNVKDPTFAVKKAQSAALAISANGATLPNAEAGLQYAGNFTFTNEWTGGWVFTVNGALAVQDGAKLVQKSGTMKANAAVAVNASATVTGQDSKWEFGPTMVKGALEVADKATLLLTKGLVVESGGALVVNGGKLTQEPYPSGTVFAVTVNAGGKFSATGATLNFANIKAGLNLAGSTAEISGSTLAIGNDSVQIGGEGGTLVFKGEPSTISSRFAMTGDKFVFHVDDATVTFASDTLFITGSEKGTAGQTSDRTLKFTGANPHLKITGNQGMFLRGTKTTLEFNLPAGEFTKEPVIELADKAQFKGDAETLAASQIVVNVDEKTKSGTYTLLKGKGAATFLKNAKKWVANDKRATIAAAKVNGVDAVQVTVK